MADTIMTDLAASAAVSGTDLLLSRQAGTSDTKTTVTQLMTYINGNGAYAGSVIAGQYGGTGVANTGKTITLGGNLTTSGAFASTFTMTNTTTVTFPTTGTLATLAGTETFSNKSFSTAPLPSTNDVAALGSSTLSWGDLFLASGGVINWNNGNVTLTQSSGALALNSALNLSVSTTTIAATATIDAAAILGQDLVTWTPSAGTSVSGTFVTGKMRKTIVNTTNGAIVSPGHAIAGYDYLEFTGGTNTADLLFVHEAKYKKTGTATVNNISFYKPAIDSVAGTHVNFTLYDADMDLSGVTFTNGYLIRNTLQDGSLNYLGKNLNIVTAGKIIRPQNGNEVPTALNPGIVTGRYYYSAEWVSCANNASTQGLLIATPPIIIPQRTTFTKIGVRVVTGVASTVARLGIYKMLNGVPNGLVLDAGTVATATNNTDAEITISQELEAGAYFLCYQSTGGVGPPTIKTFAYTDSYLEQIYGNASSQPDAATIEDWIYIANTGAFPSTFGAVTRTRVGGALPAVYLKA